jgi:hypothetical protein
MLIFSLYRLKFTLSIGTEKQQLPSNLLKKPFAMTTQDKNLTPYEVFEGSAWEAGLLKSILEDNDIEVFMTEAYALPWNSIPTKGASAKVFVALENLEQARAIVDEFYTNMQKDNTSNPQW